MGRGGERGQKGKQSQAFFFLKKKERKKLSFSFASFFAHVGFSDYGRLTPAQKITQTVTQLWHL